LFDIFGDKEKIENEAVCIASRIRCVYDFPRPGFQKQGDKMSQYTQLKAQIAQLQAQAEEVRRNELENVLADIRQKIAEYGLSAQDLGLTLVKRGRPPKKEPLPPMYQDPKSGSTWSGRGKPPKWIAGKARERFLIGQH
jgi:DNA-binding protein H-NS